MLVLRRLRCQRMVGTSSLQALTWTLAAGSLERLPAAWSLHESRPARTANRCGRLGGGFPSSGDGAKMAETDSSPGSIDDALHVLTGSQGSACRHGCVLCIRRAA